MTIANPVRTSAAPSGSPTLLRGLSWPGMAIVGGFIAVWSLGIVLHPRVGAFATTLGDFFVAWSVFTAVSLVGGVTVVVTAVVLLNLAGRAAIGRFGFAVFAGLIAAIAAAAVSYLTEAIPFAKVDTTPWMLLATWLDWALLAAVVYLYVLRADAAQAEAYESAARLNVLEKERAEMRLRLLQAQIEPHFLFNTLSNIRRLCQTDLGNGRAMLGQFGRYLRAALPRIRRDLVPLADEVELVEAYLGLQKIRMGERLGWSIEVPAEHRAALVPPMMLATLVENAIQHGLAPMVDGGSIELGSAREGDRLWLRVADTGRGFAAVSGTGVGLSNIRARLAALYGDAGRLALDANTPRGLVATISMPWSAEAPAA